MAVSRDSRFARYAAEIPDYKSAMDLRKEMTLLAGPATKQALWMLHRNFHSRLPHPISVKNFKFPPIFLLPIAGNIQKQVDKMPQMRYDNGCWRGVKALFDSMPHGFVRFHGAFQNLPAGNKRKYVDKAVEMW